MGNLVLTSLLPFTVNLEGNTEVRVSGVEAGTINPRLTVKLEFDDVIIFISIPIGSVVPTYSSFVPLLQQAVVSLRSVQRAVLQGTVSAGGQ